MGSNTPGGLTPTKRQNEEQDDYYLPPHTVDLFDPNFPTSHPTKRLKPTRLPDLTPPPSLEIPLLPSLYHFAVSAHRASARHLQQVFIPDSVTLPSPDLAIKTAAGKRFEHDAEALDKARALLVCSLDALRAGLAQKSISERERVAFSIEFGSVAIKLVQASKGDTRRILQDAAEAVGLALAISRRSSYMTASMQQLEVLDAKLQALDGRTKSAARLIRQALSKAQSGDAHCYSLRLLFLEIAQAPLTEEMSMLDEMTAEAESNGHTAIVQLAHLARLRLLFAHRQWHDIPDVLEHHLDGSDKSSPWLTHLRIHQVLYRALWLGRTGDDANVRVALKKVYELMDLYTSDSRVKALKETGGLFELECAPGQSLSLQLTPPNVLYALTYLATSVCRRDYLGSATSAKSLIMPQIMRDTADSARADDIWDLDFTASHGPANALALRREISAIRVEMMLEHVSALMYRCDNVQAEKVFGQAVRLAYDHDVFTPLAPHFCVIHAHFAHLLGRDQAALRSYRACSSLLVPGCEFASIAEIGSFACSGAFVGVLDDPVRTETLQRWVERCRPSSYACLSAAAHFVSSFLDANRVSAKRKINHAYEISVKAGWNVIRLLVFTLTTSIHMFGDESARLRQLVSGVESTRMMGGKGTKDEVGQLITGLWFAEKLKEHYRRENNVESHAKTKLVQQRHLKRLHDQVNEVPSIPCNTRPAE